MKIMKGLGKQLELIQNMVLVLKFGMKIDDE